MDFLGVPDEVKDEDFDGALVIVTDTANTERVDDQRYSGGAKIIKIDHHPNDDAYGDIILVDTDASSSSEMIYELFAAGQAQHAGNFQHLLRDSCMPALSEIPVASCFRALPKRRSKLPVN